MQQRFFSATGLAGLAVAFILVIGLLNQCATWRLDLTEQRIYTLSEGSKRLLAKLDQPVKVQLFFSQQASRELTALRDYAQRVEDLLTEMATLSSGTLEVSVIDPIPFSEQEDLANEVGIQPVQLSLSEAIYLGIAISSESGGSAVLPFLQPDRERFLEYELAQAIYQSANPALPKVGLVSGLQVSGGFDFATRQPQPAWAIIEQLQQLYQVETLDLETSPLPEDLSLLMLIHPATLSQAALYQVDQFVLGGGKVVAFVDPFAETANPGERDSVTPMLPLLRAWGVELTTQAVGDNVYALPVRTQSSPFPVRHLGLLGLNEAALSQEDIITSQLNSVNLASVGGIQPLEGASSTLQPLLSTSAQTQLLAPEQLENLQDPSPLLRSFVSADVSYPVAVRIQGEVQTAFAEGAPVAEAEEAESAEEPSSAQPHLSRAENVQLVVIADTDMLADRLWVQVQNFFGQRIVSPWADNGSLVTNIVDNLAGSEDLISIRSRGEYVRPFEVVARLRREAEGRFLQKEQELLARLEETEQRLGELQAGGDGSVLLSPEQEQALSNFQQEKIKIRKQLRDVRRQLDQDIADLDGQLKLINIGLVPVLITLFAIALAAYRRRRRSA